MNSAKSNFILLIAVLISGLMLRSQIRPASPVMPIGKLVQIKVPLGLPPVVIPADNPPTAETIALGRRLFYDPILSADRSVSCASCHSPQFGFADSRPVSEGVGKKTGTRHSPPVVNATYYTVQFWDGRSPTLENQAEGPVQNPVEMANTLKTVEERLNADASYRQQFADAWGARPIVYEMVEKSIASFERTVISGNSPFDRWKYGHDKNAVDDAVKRGFVVFTSKKKADCAACHTVGEKYALFTDNQFHNVGVGVNAGDFTDVGLYAVTHNEADKAKFKTPSLRNVAQRAPYMSDGSLKDLKQVIDFYIGAGNSNPNLDPKIHVLDFLSGQERADLQAFLNSLTGETPPDVGPPEVTKAELSRK
ncbi:MAG TPA: cytochrome c peroxidase [Candidatus Sulfotelmatobacter sp.]|jgi:cytochrome c peroxidase|nr:cytochrome c peroxidase [Candidatus Sulfotelmatobacter sp.]